MPPPIAALLMSLSTIVVVLDAQASCGMDVPSGSARNLILDCVSDVTYGGATP